MIWIKNVWSQYGFETDVFDKYREAVKRTNSDSVRALSFLAIVGGLAVTLVELLNFHQATGMVLSLIELAAGIAGLFISYRESRSRYAVLITGYVLSLLTHILAVYGSIRLNTDAFWFGTQLAIGCFLFDYAWHIGLMQVICFLILYVTWIAVPGAEVTGTRLLLSALFLVIGHVNFYTMNRTKASLVLGKEENRHAAETDLLTGLTARMAAQEEIERHLKADDCGVMMLLDLDHFKSVNDRLGHQMGDKVLMDVAADMKKMFRNSDVLSRLGGDEFVVYLKSVPEKEWALQRATQIVDEIRRWVGNGTENIQISASVGIVMTDMVERTYDNLYRAADIAMYKAKAEGGNKALFYTPEMKK